jgi:predicted aconitase with swiveling domain
MLWINKETETIVATGVILSDIPCVDRVDISGIKTGDRVRVSGDTVEIVKGGSGK